MSHVTVTLDATAVAQLDACGVSREAALPARRLSVQAALQQEARELPIEVIERLTADEWARAIATAADAVARIQLSL